MSDKKTPEVSLPGSGLLQQAARAKGSNKGLLQDLIEKKKESENKPKLNTSTPTASNPSGINKLSPEESSASLARVRAKVRAKIDAAKKAKETAKERSK